MSLIEDMEDIDEGLDFPAPPDKDERVRACALGMALRFHEGDTRVNAGHIVATATVFFAFLNGDKKQ